MTNLPMFPEHDSGDDNTPFPLFIAKRFNFPLAYHERGDEIYYAIQDWVRGLIGQNARSLIGGMQKSQIYETISNRILLLPYVSSDKKIYKRKYTTATNLVLIMAYLRNLSNRPVLTEARRLFAQRLAFKPTTSYKPVKTFFEYDFDQLDLDIEDWVSDDFLHYRMSEEEFLFYDRDFRSRFYRSHILDNFVDITKDKIKPQYYDLITDDIYKGLWKRSPATLKIQMGAASLNSVRMLMPRLGFAFHQLNEAIAIQKLSSMQDLSWHELRYTIKVIASMVGGFAKEASEYLGEDLATGHPLLKHR